MPPTLADRVFHILQAITDIERALASVDYQRFADDRLLRLAVERALEIISEASRHIPDDVKASEPGIPWERMAAFGNQTRHAYHVIDAEVVWRIAKDELSILEEFAQQVMGKEPYRPG